MNITKNNPPKNNTQRKWPRNFTKQGCRTYNSRTLAELRLINTSILNDIAELMPLRIDFGCGIKTLVDIEMLFSVGAYAVNVGSGVVNNPSLVVIIFQKHGPEKMIMSADVIGYMGGYMDGRMAKG